MEEDLGGEWRSGWGTLDWGVEELDKCWKSLPDTDFTHRCLTMGTWLSDESDRGSWKVRRLG